MDRFRFCAYSARWRTFAGAGVLMVLSGCTLLQTSPQPEVSSRPECVAAPADSALVGNWLSVREQRGVAGKLYTQMVLNLDGTMVYVEQLRRGSRPPQTLNETGCWQHDGNTLVLQTLRSNSVDVDFDDPIYRNEYTVSRKGADRLQLDGPQGSLLAERKEAGYQLSVF